MKFALLTFLKGHVSALSLDRRTAPLLVLALLVLIPAACSRNGKGTHAGRNGAAPSPAPVPTTAAAVTTVRPTLAIAGIIAPLQNVAISSTLSEPADAVNVQEGDTVRKGEVLALLDTADLRAQLNSEQRNAASLDAKVSQARYNAQLQFGQNPQAVQQARETVRQAQQTLAQDTLNLRRDQQLVSSGYVSTQTYDQQATLVNNDRAALRSAQANLQSVTINQQVNGTANQGLQAATVQSAIADAASAHASAQQTQTSIDKATIVSPVNGVVVNRNLNVGEYPSGRTLFTVQELSSVYAELNASSAQIFALQPGATVELTAAGAGNRTYRGVVIGVLGQVEPGSTNFTVKALVSNTDGKLQSGVPVSATISLPASHGVGIPVAAFLDDTHASVMVDADGTAKVVNVHEVASDGKTSIVTGLTSGEHIVSDGQLGVASGQKLTER